MWKFLANLFLYGLAIGLTLFTASRTLDLLGQWLPANQQIMQWLGLAAFEGGLYFWAFYFVTAAKGVAQRGVALLMLVVCFIAVAVATISDVLLDGAESGKLPSIPANQKQAIVVFVCVVIVLNVAAFLAAKLTHPDKLKEMAIQDAEDQIHDLELRLIRKVAPTVATQMAPIKAEQWVNDAWTRMLPGSARPAGMIEGSVQYQAEPTQPSATRAPLPSMPAKEKHSWFPSWPKREPKKSAQPAFTTENLENVFNAWAAEKGMVESQPPVSEPESKTETLPPNFFLGLVEDRGATAGPLPSQNGHK